LGIAYSNRIKGDKADNIEQAINRYQDALIVRTRNDFPQNNADTLFSLGLTYQDAKRFNEAYKTFEQAIETVESLRGEIVSGDEIKRKQTEEWNKLYHNMVKVCLELKEDTKAIEYIERSKTRNLTELLAIKDIYPAGDIPENIRSELRQLRQDIDIEKRRIAAEEKPDSTHINKLRHRFNELFPYKPIQFDEIKKLLDKETAIIQFYIFYDSFKVFIITCDNDKPIIWHSQTDGLEKLVDWIEKYLGLYDEDKKEWISQLTNQLTELASILQIDEIISLVPSHCKKVILVPHLYLHLLPLHALPLSSGEYLIDKFSDGVSYAPSCQLLQYAQQKLQKPRQSRHLFAIQNPTKDLEFTDIEVETIAATNKPHHIIKKSAATKDALLQPANANHLNDAYLLHFSCHGYFNLSSPLESGLLLANSQLTNIPTNAVSTSRYVQTPNTTIDLQQCLTLEDIFRFNLPNCRLVVLSACETGLTDFTSMSDEYIGLPSGFIRAGSPSVVSSLWSVSDISTALLMIKFYENLQNLDVPLALKEAQTWLRNATKQQLEQWASNKFHNPEHIAQLQLSLFNQSSNSKPFESPYYWAAFCAIGK